MIDTFAIPLTFIIVASLTLWIVIGSKGWWWLKALTVIITTAFSIILWQSLGELQGWPTKDEIPEKFEVKWIAIQEPNQKTNDAGAIYIWTKDLDKSKKNHSWYMRMKFNNLSEEPRIYKMPYSRELHEKAIKIQKAIASGGKFYAEKDGKEGTGNGKGGKGPQGDGRGEGKGGGMSQPTDPMFHELPPPHYPEKLLQ